MNFGIYLRRRDESGLCRLSAGGCWSLEGILASSDLRAFLLLFLDVVIFVPRLLFCRSIVEGANLCQIGCSILYLFTSYEHLIMFTRFRRVALLLAAGFVINITVSVTTTATQDTTSVRNIISTATTALALPMAAL